MNQETLVLHKEICMEKIFREHKLFAFIYKHFQI